VAAYLHEYWRDGDEIWVAPKWDGDTYIFYLETAYHDSRLTYTISLNGTKPTPDLGEMSARVFLIGESSTPGRLAALEQAGFTPVFSVTGQHLLWVRKE
jgi:hypothetical protein